MKLMSKFYFLYLCIIIIYLFNQIDADKPCIPRWFNKTSLVCVCNSTYCDEIDSIKKLPERHYIAYTSTMDGLRFEKETGEMTQNMSIGKQNNFLRFLKNVFSFIKEMEEPSIIIHRNRTFQKIIGFGVSISDAVGYNMKKLNKSTYFNVLKSYYGKTGLECNMNRLPIGGTDYSLRPYAYNELPEDDVKLSNYSLTFEDFAYKMPIMRDIMKLSPVEVYFIATAWSPPKWMKVVPFYYGIGKLYEKYYQTWADYHLRFLEEYRKRKFKFWGITTGNEPSIGVLPLRVNSLGFFPDEQSKWIVNHFGPTIRNSNFKNIKIIGLDDMKSHIPWWIDWMVDTDPRVLDYIDGIGTHWYLDEITPVYVNDRTHDSYPDKFLISTESCSGFFPWLVERVQFGSWERAEEYIFQLIDNFNHWFTSWIEWNMVLNEKGGPSWVNNHNEPPIIVFPEVNEFIKEPTFYAFGHFSKFIPRGSVRVETELVTGKIDNIAFLRPDNGITVIFYNPTEKNRVITIIEEGMGCIKLNVPKRSIQTVVYY